jgi:hypothetical protein
MAFNVLILNYSTYFNVKNGPMLYKLILNIKLQLNDSVIIYLFWNNLMMIYYEQNI